MTLEFRALLGLYSIGIELAVWTALVPVTFARMLAGRASARELSERLGRVWRPRGRRLIVHAVSAGEMNAAEPLVARLAAEAGTILLTTGTRAGMASGERTAAAHPHVEGCVYLPWDRHAIGAWLTANGATAVVVIETEIWPNLFTACRRLNLPLFIANGRVRSGDVARYRLARRFFRPVLASAAWIGAQDAGARDAFVAIGAAADRVEVCGNLKLDAVPRPLTIPAAARRALDGYRLLVAGSTHAPEEAWLLECGEALRRAGHATRFVVAPRDVGRAAEVARLAERRALRSIRWSELRRVSADPVPAWDVLVVDEYGWLTAFYEAADLVFLGGTLAKQGGHNLAEPAAFGRPVIVGPHVDGIATLVAELTEGGGVVRLPDGPMVPALVDACAKLLSDPAGAQRIGAAAQAICGRMAGAGDRHRDAIAGRLGPA